jgi:hypothetical protein
MISDIESEVTMVSFHVGWFTLEAFFMRTSSGTTGTSGERIGVILSVKRYP